VSPPAARARRRGRLLALIAAVLGAAAGLPAAAAGGGSGPVGEQRLLVLPVTWGPRPWSLEEIRRETIEAPSAWVRRVSYGRAWLSGSVAPWLEIDHRADDCSAVRLATKSRTAAAAQGIDVRGYDRVAYLHPRGACPWAGFAGTDDFWLNGALRSKVVVHELGHTWGLEHANSLQCGGGGCETVEYGDPYSAMGRGDGDFTAFEKFTVGWISDVELARPGVNASVGLGPLEVPSELLQAFIARSAAGQFWFEYRSEARAVLVHSDATPAGSPMVGVPNLLVVDAAAPGRPELRAGERFTAAGAFAVSIASLAPDAARLDFEWIDRVPPRAPSVTVPKTVRAASGRFVVRWRGTDERGSGLDRFEISLDGRRHTVAPDPLGTQQRIAFSVPAAGRHTVVVTAVDRAGNRSSSRRQFVVTGTPPSARPRRLEVDVGGFRLFVECRGAGSPTVVFDAGLNETGGSWTSILPAVARETRACSFDRAGRGASDPRPGNSPATIATLADELHTLLTRGRIGGPYVLVGHSLGGVDSLVFAARHPTDTAGLVFVDTPDPDILAGRGVLLDGDEPIDMRPLAAEVRGVTLGATPAMVLFASGRPDSAAALARRSTNHSLVFVPRTGHHIHQERPRLVIEAIRQVVVAAPTGAPLPACRQTSLPRLGGECVDPAGAG
jgi:pimeloyl-ACP methyl ester carboxylesterase